MITRGIKYPAYFQKPFFFIGYYCHPRLIFLLIIGNPNLKLIDMSNNKSQHETELKKEKKTVKEAEASILLRYT